MSYDPKRMAETRKASPKAFLAKLLVLCMILGMIPATIALAADGDVELKIASYDANQGSVTYKVGQDTIDVAPNGGTYTVSGDTLEVTLTPQSNYKVSGSATYVVTKDADAVTYYFNQNASANGATTAKIKLTDVKSIAVNPAFVSTTSTSPGTTGGGGGGGGTTTSETTVENPSTSGGSTTVVVDVKPSGSGATSSVNVDSKKMDEAVKSAVDAASKAGTDPVIEVKVETPAAATGMKVTLPSAPLEELGKDSGATLIVTSGVAELTLDSTALEAVAEQAGTNVTVSVAPAAQSSLSAAQKETVGTAPVFDLNITSGGKAITSFDGGVLTVALPYTLAEGQSASDVVVYYLTDAAKLEACPTSFRSGTVTFTTTHLSKYVIGDEAMADDGNPFDDVVDSDYYYDAVLWAVDKGITTGTSATTFGPSAPCTRGQIVTFLWHAKGDPEPASTVNPFTDVSSGDYFYKAVLWAVEKGITAGTSETTFGPSVTCTRAQAMTFLYKAQGASATPTSSFSDVAASDYFAAPVAWAVANGITAGAGNGTFGSNSNCTRAQIVTFLYKAIEG